MHVDLNIKINKTKYKINIWKRWLLKHLIEYPKLFHVHVNIYESSMIFRSLLYASILAVSTYYIRHVSLTGTKVKGLISIERFRFSFDTLTQVRCLQTWGYILCEKYEISKFRNFQNEKKNHLHLHIRITVLSTYFYTDRKGDR